MLPLATPYGADLRPTRQVVFSRLGVPASTDLGRKPRGDYRAQAGEGGGEFIKRVEKVAEARGFSKGRNSKQRSSPWRRDGGLKHNPGRVVVPEPEEVDEAGNWCP